MFVLALGLAFGLVWRLQQSADEAYQSGTPAPLITGFVLGQSATR
jgi:hypothetical protein